jgi:hypothetical protein
MPRLRVSTAGCRAHHRLSGVDDPLLPAAGPPWFEVVAVQAGRVAASNTVRTFKAAENRLRVHELEGNVEEHGGRAATQRPVARLLRSYRELAEERADLEALLTKLAPAWGELRKVLIELNRQLRDP